MTSQAPQPTTTDDVEGSLKRNRRRSYAAIALAVVAILLAIFLRSCAALNDTNGAGSSCSYTAGPSGAAGVQGLSAYDLWLKVGNTGTQQAFLDSLVGKPGADGYVGSNGFTGATGATGKSAYQVWLDSGRTGTSQDFLNSLVGPAGVAGVNGLSAYSLWIKLGHVGTETDFLNSLIGPTGAIGATGAPGICTTGDTGATGATGLSAYQVWLANGHTGGTEAEFLASLIGPTGSPGPQGIQGIQGIQGPSGAPGTSGISSTYRGSFLSLLNQTVSAVNTRTAMFFEETDISNGVTITNSVGGSCTGTPATCTDITFANAGVYNISFSAQLFNNTGGGSGNTIKIWLGRNHANVVESATNISANSNNPYRVAAWNFFITASAGDTAQLYWSTDTTRILILAEAGNETGPIAQQYPAIPSLILTVNQVG